MSLLTKIRPHMNNKQAWSLRYVCVVRASSEKFHRNHRHYCQFELKGKHFFFLMPSTPEKRSCVICYYKSSEGKLNAQKVNANAKNAPSASEWKCFLLLLFHIHNTYF